MLGFSPPGPEHKISQLQFNILGIEKLETLIFLKSLLQLVSLFVLEALVDLVAFMSQVTTLLSKVLEAL